jgi:hypothetical protein
MSEMDEEVEEIAEMYKHRTDDEVLDQLIEFLNAAYFGFEDGEINVGDIKDAMVFATVLKNRSKK